MNSVIVTKLQDTLFYSVTNYNVLHYYQIHFTLITIINKLTNECIM